MPANRDEPENGAADEPATGSAQPAGQPAAGA